MAAKIYLRSPAAHAWKAQTYAHPRICSASPPQLSAGFYPADLQSISRPPAWRTADHGRRTVTNLLRPVRHQAPGYASSYHRVFSQRHWSPWKLARVLLRFLFAYVVPPGPVFLAGDDTVAEHPGPKVFDKGCHRDGVRSTHSYTACRWGHKWVVVSVLVKCPFATRSWALPVLVALYRAVEWDQAHGTRHKTPAHLTVRLCKPRQDILDTCAELSEAWS